MSAPTYTYTPDTPASATPFNDTQSPILMNFEAIAEYLPINHASFNNILYFGKHLEVTMPNQDPIPSQDPQAIQMFVQATGSPNPSEIFILYPTGAQTSTPVQISFGSSSPSQTGFGTSGGSGSQGWCSFPSGILFRWGTFSLQGKLQGKVSYTSGPFYTNPTYYNAATAATSSGCLNQLGVLITGYTTTSYFSPIFYGSSSSSVVTNFNYLNIGM